MKADQRRSAALLLAPAPAARLGEAELAAAAAPFRHATRVPPLPARLAQAVALKRGRLDWERSISAPLAAARRAALAAEAGEAPRVLVRVDEFPHARAFDSSGPFGTDAYRRFHAVLAEAGIPYLVAVPPRVSSDYLNPGGTESRPLDGGEAGLLAELAADGVAFGLHGLDHRTRHASPRRHSELLGLGPDETAERVDTALAATREIGVETEVFVPPFNRFSAAQYEILARRFEVVCGGPESVRLLGFPPTPVWRGEAVYLPSYAPLYGRAAAVANGVDRMVAAHQPVWAPVTLHWGWELEDDLRALRGLCRALAGIARPWEELLAAVHDSRAVA